MAANQKGIQLVSELIASYGLTVVQAYMAHIQHNAELAVRDMLRQVGRQLSATNQDAVLSAEDFMDDGSPIRLSVRLDRENGSAVFDFT